MEPCFQCCCALWIELPSPSQTIASTTGCFAVSVFPYLGAKMSGKNGFIPTSEKRSDKVLTIIRCQFFPIEQIIIGSCHPSQSDWKSLLILPVFSDWVGIFIALDCYYGGKCPQKWSNWLLFFFFLQSISVFSLHLLCIYRKLYWIWSLHKSRFDLLKGKVCLATCLTLCISKLS